MDFGRLSESDIQAFIEKHEEEDPHQLMLRAANWPELPMRAIVEQIQSRKKARRKLSKWYATPGVVFPNTGYLEQSSSEKTAEFKASIIKGKSLLDLTGGTGIDSYYFAQYFSHVVYNEPNAALAGLAEHNFRQLGVSNVSFSNLNAEDFLKEDECSFDWVYLDPSRRLDGQKVFKLRDCQPDVLQIVPLILKFGARILLKLSPLIDISQVLREIDDVSKVSAVSVHNDCKELLIQIESKKKKPIAFEAINITNHGCSKFSFIEGNEESAIVKLSDPRNYLYEPNSSILKLGAFKFIANQYDLLKLNPNTHLYTSDKLVSDFPGRTFQIISADSFNWQELKRWKNKKVNITTRNFPHSVEVIRKKTRMKEGGNGYLLFAKSLENTLLTISCKKI